MKGSLCTYVCTGVHISKHTQKSMKRCMVFILFFNNNYNRYGLIGQPNAPQLYINFYHRYLTGNTPK